VEVLKNYPTYKLVLDPHSLALLIIPSFFNINFYQNSWIHFTATVLTTLLGATESGHFVFQSYFIKVKSTLCLQLE
jgi:hypothetical protein